MELLRLTFPDGLGHVRAEGEIDMATAPALADTLAAAARDGHPLTVDLAAVTFIDSAGLRVILEFAMSDGRLPLVLMNPSDHLLRVFEIAGLTNVSQIEIRVDGVDG